jgi:hypothetical protein
MMLKKIVQFNHIEFDGIYVTIIHKFPKKRNNID